MPKMNSGKPYLIRAMYEWISDNKLTPYIVIDTTQEGVHVPENFISEGQITLNISNEACQGFHITNDRIVFSASFSGVAMQIVIPPQAVQAVYAQENGRGMAFTDEEFDGDGEEVLKPKADLSAVPSVPSTQTSKKGAKGKPKLTIVK